MCMRSEWWDLFNVFLLEVKVLCLLDVLALLSNVVSGRQRVASLLQLW